MTRTTRFGLLAALPAALLAISALAQTAPPTTATPANGASKLFEHMLKKYDANGDGKISHDEYIAAATAHFQAIDAQHAGKINAAEIATSPNAAKRIERRAEGLVQHLDTAGNGYITQDEFLAAAKKRFARLDKQGNGQLTLDELTPRFGRRGDANGVIAQAAQAHFAKLDTNHDGVVTLDEYLAFATADYQALDTAHNGQVTAAEIAASPKAQERAAKIAAGLVKHLDTDGDGVVSQDEFLGAAEKRFARMDKNGDGYIEADEVHGHSWAHGGKARNDG
ncbi:MAG TPA: EF-hand domain-containing protein [Rudaea sp.]